jgi:hypothetical protein
LRQVLADGTPMSDSDNIFCQCIDNIWQTINFLSDQSGLSTAGFLYFIMILSIYACFLKDNYGTNFAMIFFKYFDESKMKGGGRNRQMQQIKKQPTNILTEEIIY